MAAGQTSPRKVTALEREHKAIELRTGGATFKQIADVLGVTRGAACKAVKRAMDKLVAETQEQTESLRALENKRLDALFLAFWPKALAGDEAAATRCMNIMERRARMNGLDGPIEIKDTTPVDQGRAKLLALLGFGDNGESLDEPTADRPLDGGQATEQPESQGSDSAAE